MINLLNLYYDIIFKPEDMINHLETINKKILIFHKVLVSIFLAGSIFVYKRKIVVSDFVFFVLLIFFIYLFISVFSRVLSLFYYNTIAKNQRYMNEAFTKINKMIGEIQSILEFSWFPMIFFIHFSVLSKYFHSYFLVVFGLGILIVWMFYIWLRSLQYYLEWELKFLLRVTLQHFIILFSFFILSVVIFFISGFIIINL